MIRNLDSEMVPEFDSTQWIAAKTICVVSALVSTFGIITNFLLSLATYRSTALKSKCNFLIGLCAIFDVIHLFGMYPPLSIFIGDGHIDSFNCIILEFASEIGLSAGCFCVLSIGVDRLLSVSLVVFYRNINRRLYLAIHIIAICAFASYAPVLMLKFYEPRRVMCTILESYYGFGRIVWIEVMLVVNFLTLLPYALTWMKLTAREESSYTKRAFRAIALVMIFDVGSWLMAAVIGTLLHVVNISVEYRLVLLYCCGVIVHIGISAKPIIYYTTSTEYHKAVRALFGMESAYANPNSYSNPRIGKKLIKERSQLSSSPISVSRN